MADRRAQWRAPLETNAPRKPRHDSLKAFGAVIEARTGWKLTRRELEGLQNTLADLETRHGAEWFVPTVTNRQSCQTLRAAGYLAHRTAPDDAGRRCNQYRVSDPPSTLVRMLRHVRTFAGGRLIQLSLRD